MVLAVVCWWLGESDAGDDEDGVKMVMVGWE